MSHLPDGWVQATLAEVSLPRKEKVAPREQPNARFVGLEHVEAHSMRLLGSQPALELKSAAAAFRPGDVLYGRLRPYLNKVLVAEFEGLCSAEFIVLPPNEAVDGPYLARLLNAREFVDFASNLNQGDRPRVDFEQIGKYELHLPPLAEQRRIIAEIEALMARSRRAREALTAVPPLIERYRQAVLAAAFRGDLTADWRAQNQDVEPTSALLDRIRTERRRRWEEAELTKLRTNGKEPKDDRWKARYKEPDVGTTQDLGPLPESWVWASVDSLATKVVDGDLLPLRSLA